MLSIFLGILKIIGIVLLSLLGLVVLLLLLILFAPIRYRVKGRLFDKKPELDGKITWFIPGFRCLFRFDDKLDISVKLFGHSFYPEKELSPEEEAKKAARQEKKDKKRALKEEKLAKKEARKEQKQRPSEENPATEEVKEEQKQGLLETADSNEKDITHEVQETEKTVLSEDLDTENRNVQDFDPQNDEKEEKSIFQKISDYFRSLFAKIRSFFGKLKELFGNIQLTFSKICDKINGVKNKVGYYYNLWQKDATRMVWDDCKGRLVKLFKHLKPKKFRIDLHVGMEDPSTTGMIMGIWGMLYPILGGSIYINPEFDREVLEGNLIIKGKIRIIHVLMVALQFYRDKRLKKLIELVKKGGK